MLYIFYVNTGTMMTFDMNLALENVSHLKKSISSHCQIPEEKQVLLISGGESLNESSRVCSYNAGTDTNPIFLFNKLSIESSSPPACVTDYGPDPDMRERVEGCIDMNPNYNTVVARAEMAQQLYETAKQQLHTCERLVHDQHLQQQGWAAVVANLEDIATDFSNTSIQLEERFHQFVENRDFYYNLLRNFDNDLKILSQIPVLSSLLHPNSSERNDNTRHSLSLLEWIGERDSQSSLEQLSEQCLKGIDQFDFGKLDKVKEEINEVLELSNQSNMKEVRGLEERLYGLEKLMCEAKKIVDVQKDLAQTFYQNQTRASNLRDPSILPDLCASHKQQLQVMLKNHQYLRDIRRRCAKAKEELSVNLHTRLKWIMFAEEKLFEIDATVLIYRENLRRLKKHLEVVHQFHLAPQIYLSSIVEVVRRKAYSKMFWNWTSNLAQQLSRLYENEIEKRKSFSVQMGDHFLQILFPGMNDFPPPFATESPAPFDTELPELIADDIEYLRTVLPDHSALLRVPSPVPMPEPSNNDRSIFPLANDTKNSIEIKIQQKSKASDSDTEEFETVTDELPKWQESDTKPSSPDQEIDVHDNAPAIANNEEDFVTGEFVMDECITITGDNDTHTHEIIKESKDVNTNTSQAFMDINEFNLKHYEWQNILEEKSRELNVSREQNDITNRKLNVNHDLIKSFALFAKNFICDARKSESDLRDELQRIRNESITSLNAIECEFINILIGKDEYQMRNKQEFDYLTEKYEENTKLLTRNIETLSSDLELVKCSLKAKDDKIRSLTDTMYKKGLELNELKTSHEQILKQMNAEREIILKKLQETELENEQLKQKIKQEISASITSTLCQNERLAILSCEIGDIVLIHLEERFGSYIVFTLSPDLHFLHTDCLDVLHLNTTESVALRQKWTIAEVTDKEYCQARKAHNRYRVPINTKFYRVKARPWAKAEMIARRTTEHLSASTSTLESNPSQSSIFSKSTYN